MPAAYSFRLAACLLLSAGACHPDAPATRQAPLAAAPAATPATTVPPAATPATSAAAELAGKATDTLHLPGGQVLRLLPAPAAAFNQLAADSLPDLDADSPDQHLEATQGRVRRQGLDLLLTPTQGPVVQLASTPPAKFTLQNGDAVRYVYWGSLPAAHQWVVQAWYWESDGIMLVDQRTGRRLELTGHPVASPDGRYVLAASAGLGGGDQPNSLSLAEITAAGPRLRWEREPTAWAPERVRWSGPRQALLEIARPAADGQLPYPPRPDYLRLALPAAP